MRDIEGPIHRSILAYLSMALKNHGANCSPVWHTPNNPRSNVAGARLKALGMRKGFPDLSFLCNGKFYCIEAKPEGQYLRPSQKEWLGYIEAAGGFFAVCRSIYDAEETLREWGLLK